MRGTENKRKEDDFISKPPHLSLNDGKSPFVSKIMVCLL